MTLIMEILRLSIRVWSDINFKVNRPASHGNVYAAKSWMYVHCFSLFNQDKIC